MPGRLRPGSQLALRRRASRRPAACSRGRACRSTPSRCRACRCRVRADASRGLRRHRSRPAGRPSAPIAVALRAWVPQEYAAHLAPFGVHVIAAGGSVTSEQAQGWGADVLVVSAECLGQDVHLLQQPQLPTVFITPQPVMIPDVAGVVQVQEPLRASDVAQAARDAAAAFAAARR